MTPAQKAVATALVGVFAALAVAAPGLVEDEGVVLKTYPDPVSIATVCAGVTGPRYGVRYGVTYTLAECVPMTARAMLDHALEISTCLPAGLPTNSFAAFIRFAYNVGSTRACSSTMFRKARAGDLAGACRQMQFADDGRPQWVWATKPDGQKVKLPGLERRRAAERALCESGLK